MLPFTFKFFNKNFTRNEIMELFKLKKNELESIYHGNETLIERKNMTFNINYKRDLGFRVECLSSHNDKEGKDGR